MKGDSRYQGRAGELRLISEFLLRGFNCAIPEIDEGDDFLVLYKDLNLIQNTARIQVKSSKKSKNKFQFNIPNIQLLTPTAPEIFYCFIFWKQDYQPEFYFIPRDQLSDLITNDQKIGSLGKNNQKWNVSFPEPKGRILLGRKRADISQNFLDIDAFVKTV